MTMIKCAELQIGGTRIGRSIRNSARLACMMLGGLMIAQPSLAAETAYTHFSWQQVADGVWFGTTQPNSFQTGNTVIVELPGKGSLIVDSHNSEYLGREIIEKAKQVAPGPVLYLVNTHLHQDHVGGNAAFRKAFPKVEIIAHRNTCWGITEKSMPRMKARIGGLTQQLEGMRKKRAELPDTDKDAAALDRRIAGTALYLEDARNFDWVLPSTCADMKPGAMRAIVAGGRRVEIRYFGGGHTAGDLVVFLPKEKMIAMGDLWSENGDLLLDSGLDGRDGSVLAAPATLRAISKLDFDKALPGHRSLIQGKTSLEAAIANGDKLVGQIKESYARGEYVEEALQKIPSPTPQMATAWQRTLIRGFEELEQRKQAGMKLP